MSFFSRICCCKKKPSRDVNIKTTDYNNSYLDELRLLQNKTEFEFDANYIIPQSHIASLGESNELEFDVNQIL